MPEPALALETGLRLVSALALGSALALALALGSALMLVLEMVLQRASVSPWAVASPSESVLRRALG
jgi:hypothetical protein